MRTPSSWCRKRAYDKSRQVDVTDDIGKPDYARARCAEARVLESSQSDPSMSKALTVVAAASAGNRPFLIMFAAAAAIIESAVA